MLDVRFFADFVRFSPNSGRIDTVTVESARDPLRTYGVQKVCVPKTSDLRTLVAGG